MKVLCWTRSHAAVFLLLSSSWSSPSGGGGGGPQSFVSASTDSSNKIIPHDGDVGGKDIREGGTLTSSKSVPIMQTMPSDTPKQQQHQPDNPFHKFQLPTPYQKVYEDLDDVEEDKVVVDKKVLKSSKDGNYQAETPDKKKDALLGDEPKKNDNSDLLALVKTALGEKDLTKQEIELFIKEKIRGETDVDLINVLAVDLKENLSLLEEIEPHTKDYPQLHLALRVLLNAASKENVLDRIDTSLQMLLDRRQADDESNGQLLSSSARNDSKSNSNNSMIATTTTTGRRRTMQQAFEHHNGPNFQGGSRNDQYTSSSSRKPNMGGSHRQNPFRRTTATSSGPRHLENIHHAILNGDHEYIQRSFASFQEERFQDYHRGSTQEAPDDITGRRLTEFEDAAGFEGNCEILKKCVLGMSLYDFFVYYYSDDIDNEDGTIDNGKEAQGSAPNVPGTRNGPRRTFDESDLFEKFMVIQDLAEDLDTSNRQSCSNLLQEFHRNIEFGDVNNWEGASVSQVCLAEGAPIYLQIAAIASVGTQGRRIAGEVFRESFRCAQELYRSEDRKETRPDEKFVFETDSKDISLPIRYCQPEDTNPSCAGNNNPFDKHGQLMSNGRYPFATKALPISVTFEGYDFDARIANDECQADPTDCAEAKRLCEAGVRSFYSRIFLSRSIGAENCYPDIRLITARSAVDFPPPFPDGTDVRYSTVVDPNTDCVYDSSITYSGCSGWRERDTPTDASADDIPPCGNGCLYASIPDGGNIFEGLSDFSELDMALELVFGNKPSVGLICAIANTVADDEDPQNLPGECCLDAPYQTEPWGQPFSCGDGDCKNKGPYFGGIDSESCDAYGGTWCPLPQNCTGLQTCVQKFTDCAIEEVEEAKMLNMSSPVRPFLQYLKDSPRLRDPSDARQCGRTRQYFGFDRDFLDDDVICANIEQFRLTDDFDFLDEFFDQGSVGNCEGNNPYLCLLESPEAITDAFVLSGAELRSNLFAYSQVSQAAEDVFSAAQAVECPSPDGGTCAAVKNVASVASFLAYVITRVVNDVYERDYSENAELGNIEPQEIYRNTKVIYDNMGRMLEVIFDTLGGGSKQGCDGIDQDNENGPDDCGEDKEPPFLVIPDVFFTMLQVPCTSPSNTVCLDKYFGGLEAVEDAKTYLRNTLEHKVTDDCGQPEDISIEIVASEESCEQTEFEVIPRHHCDDNNIFEGKPQRFGLRVDSSAPEVTCGFLSTSTDALSATGKELFVVEDATVDFLDTSFYFDIQENCPGTVQVTLDISVNEFVNDEIAVVRKWKQEDKVEQAKIFVSPHSCATGTAKSSLCVAEPSAGFRFYEITVSAVDQAGNKDEDTCVVILVPENNSNGNDKRKRLSVMTDLAALSTVRIPLESLALDWENDLAPSEMPSTTPSVSSEPTVTVQPSTEPSRGKGGKGKGGGSKK